LCLREDKVVGDFHVRLRFCVSKFLEIRCGGGSRNREGGGNLDLLCLIEHKVVGDIDVSLRICV
jgi:hypothetical protein